MTRRLLRRAFLLAVSLGVLMLMAGCGGGGGGSISTPTQTNNPVPTISSLSPTSAAVGAAAQTLTINGASFITTSTVTYNGVAHAATYVSASQLTIQLTTGDQATAGTFAVVVTNPSPGGGASNSVNFTVNNPTPAISGLNPSSTTFGHAAQTLQINGTGFVSTSTVTYNGTAHSATFVGASQLTIQLTAGDQATAGNYAVVVTNPVPGGGASNSANFAINNPVPVISSLSPSSVAVGAAPQTLTIYGSNFLPSSQVALNNDVDVAATTYVSSTELTLQLLVGYSNVAGSKPVWVINPPPGGGQSNTVNFTIAGPTTPTISSLSPSSVTEGTTSQTLDIFGTNFQTTSIVTYNAVQHNISYISATEISIQLTAGDMSEAGAYPVVVSNLGVKSNSVNFIVSSSISVIISNPASPASVNVGSTLPITVSVTGATANVVWTVDGVSGGDSTYGTVSGTYPSYTYTPPTVIPGNDNPVTLEATQSGTDEDATLMVTIKGSTTAKTAVSVAAGSTASGIDFNLTVDSSITLGLADIGTCNYPTANLCQASVTGIQISQSGAATSSCPNATCTVYLLGQGLSNTSGTTVTTGLTIQVSDGSAGGIAVGTITAGPVTNGYTGVNFPVTVSSGTALGIRDLIVTLPDGETQVYVGAIQIVN